jgi:hypothetical protein
LHTCSKCREQIRGSASLFGFAFDNDWFAFDFSFVS